MTMCMKSDCVSWIVLYMKLYKWQIVFVKVQINVCCQQMVSA